MEKRRLIVAMLVAMIAVVGWNYLTRYIAHQNNWSMPAERQASTQPAADATTTDGAATPLASGTQPTTGEAAGGPAGGPVLRSGDLRVQGAAGTAATQPAVVLLGSKSVLFDKDNSNPYAMAMRVAPRGAGLDEVVLNQFRKAVKSNDAYVYQTPIDGRVDETRPLATDSVTVDGKTVSLRGIDWQVVDQSVNAATLSVVVSDPSGNPLVRVNKRYEVFPKGDARFGYEARVTQAVENLSKQPVTVKATLNGPTPPIREMDATDDRQVLAGYLATNAINVGHWTLTEFVKNHVTRDVTTNDKNQPLQWFGSSSVYFDAIVRPVAAAEGRLAMPVAKVQATGLNPDADPLHRQVATTFQTAEVVVPAGQAAELPMDVFFGPKKRDVLNSAYYSQPPLDYDQTLNTLSSGMCGFCAFQPVINVLVWMLQGFHYLFRDWGLAIIALVVVVRLCLHPITKRSTISMQKMQKMGPEMERLKQKYKDKPDELNKATMQLYKEQGATPILGCLPMFAQMPIWIALWSSLQATFELRHAPFLHPFGIPLTWINDLSKPDAAYTFANPVPIPLIFTTWHLHSINLLPLLMGVVFYLQQKFTPKPATLTPEQAQQQKMMTWMSTLLFPLMLYTGPSGLNLYILTSTTIGILESKRIRDHIKAQEEAQKDGRVMVEPTRKMRKRGGDNGSGVRRVEPDEPKGGLGGWFARMQQMAEDVRREQEKKGRGGK
jgi:YidC/Oxa1 family membrane protein insertase